MNVNLLEAPAPIAPALFVAFLVAGTALGFYLVRLALNSGGGREAGPNPTDAAAEDARLALENIPPDASYGDAVTSIAQILRQYLDERFGFKTERMPGAEIERALTRGGCARATGRLIGHLLERCDSASDERIARDASAIQEELRLAREIIELTA